MSDSIIINAASTENVVLSVNTTTEYTSISVFEPGSAIFWGSIKGVLTLQTDLWSSLSAKALNTDLISLSSSVISLNSFLGALSGNWNSSFITVKSLSGNWQSTYETVSSLSANWQRAYNIATTYQNTSGSFATNTLLQSTSALLTPLTVTNTLTSQLVRTIDLNSLSATLLTRTDFNTASSQLVLNTTLNALSGNWQGTFTSVRSNSANWNYGFNAGTIYSQNSASYATINYVDSNFFNLTGGTISGPTRINNNLTVFGNLTATGTTTFANTVFSVTSSLSVVHVGSGPALYVGNNGDGDIASFYDVDQGVEILHVGGNNGSFPNVGVKTSTPNVDFTVNGQISANNIIWSANGNSNQWNSVYSSWNSASATSIISFNDTRFSKLSSQAYTLVDATSSIQPTRGGNVASGKYSVVAGGGSKVVISGGGSALTNNLLAYYKLDNDGSGGVSLVDSTGNGYTLTNSNGAILGTGKINGSVAVDGTKWLSTNTFPPPATGDFSASLWAYVDSYRSYQTLVATRSVGSFTSSTAYSITVSPLGYIVVYSGGFIINDNIVPISSGTWTHITVTRVSGVCTVYLNGNFAATGAWSNNLTETSFSLGSIEGYESLNGKLDEVGVWNRALSPSEVIALYNSNAGLSYPFNGGGSVTTFVPANTASGDYSFIAGGSNNNTNNKENTFILGSNITALTANYTYVNNLSSQGLIVANGGNSNQWNTAYQNISSQAYTFVNATSSIQPIRGTNTASGNSSNVSGGIFNTACGNGSTVAGGTGNTASGNSSNVSGGISNTASGNYSNVGGGGGGNTASGNSSNVAGGTFNTACGNSSNVSGGWSNTASGCYSTVAGGYQNTASGVYSSVAGGSGNTACGVGSTVAGGIFNTASGSISNVAGGRDNTASGPYSNVAGGCQNTASGYYSSILGGLCNNTNNQANTFILGSNITALSANYTYVNNISSQGIVSANGGNSNQWNETYTTYTANSASYATLNYVDNNFFNLSGGTISGATRINNNLTVFGNLTATGTTTFANTIFSVTSSLSVVHIGSGPALYVGNNGDGDIASFYDIDQGIEILHVGGINSSFPNVGIKTSAPNKTLTVVGEISATSDITTTGTIEAAILRISSAPATFINPLTASNSFLVVNVNGVDKALQLWDFTS